MTAPKSAGVADAKRQPPPRLENMAGVRRESCPTPGGARMRFFVADLAGLDIGDSLHSPAGPARAPAADGGASHDDSPEDVGR
jgi:hypothetical protein